MILIGALFEIEYTCDTMLLSVLGMSVAMMK